MKKKNIIIVVISLLTFFYSGGIIFFAIQKQNKSSTIKQTSTCQQAKINNYSPKTLASAIKADLQGALTNENRQTKYFPDYQLFDDGDIWIPIRNKDEKNENLREELQENFNRNYARRKERLEKAKREHIKKHGPLSSKYYEREVGWPEKEKEDVWKSDLEPQDHQEIVDLVRRIRDLTIEKAERPFYERMEKLNSNNKLFLGPLEVRECPWKTGSYVNLLGKEKGKFYTLSIPEKHPALSYFLKIRDNKEIFYWIEEAENILIEKNPSEYVGNEYNKYHKWISLTDKITVTLADF